MEKVSELLTASGQWNEQRVRDIFCEFDVEAILSTPCNGHGDDFWAWELEKHGVYSVRSAYRKLEADRRLSKGNNLAEHSSDADWRTLWKLEVPPKVRVFWWGVLHEFLPARQVLFRRHIEKIANCEMCREPMETIKHVLVDSSVARQFWQYTKEINGVKLPKLHGLTWAHDLLQPDFCPRKEAAMILCGMCSLWMMRNQRRHGEVPIPIRQAVDWVRDTAYDLWHLLHPQKKDKMVQKPVWRRPPEQWYKFNTDGAFFANEKNGTTGAVIRDQDGRFVAGRSAWYGSISEAIMIEAIACRDGVQLAKQMNLTKVCLETDCLELTKLWDSLNTQRSAVSLILQGIWDITRSFHEFSFVYVSRNCNRVPHECARQATREHTRVEWQLNPPDALRDLLYNDCNQPSLS